MLDVLHFFMEEELSEDVETLGARRTNLRKHVYSILYDKDYKYYVQPKLSEDEQTFDSAESLPIPFNPSDPTREVKPFIPPTQFDPSSDKPFGDILDGPLN